MLALLISCFCYLLRSQDLHAAIQSIQLEINEKRQGAGFQECKNHILNYKFPNGIDDELLDFETLKMILDYVF